MKIVQQNTEPYPIAVPGDERGDRVGPATDSCSAAKKDLRGDTSLAAIEPGTVRTGARRITAGGARRFVELRTPA
jgi:hypothetical protein